MYAQQKSANTPRISFIIPTYNEENYLPLCLDSIFELDYPGNLLDVIVVDNGSEDKTVEIAKSYDVKVLCDANKNVSGLRNLGAMNAQGEILAFLDADCVLTKTGFVYAIQYFNDQEIAAWGGPPVPSESGSWVQKTWFLLISSNKEKETVDWLGAVDLFVRRQQFLEVGGFNESLVSCEDVDLCYRMNQRFGKIISDARIKITHLREADTVWQFMKKEMWRGRSNLRGVMSHGFSLKELPSLAIPFYFLLLTPLMLIGSLFLYDFLLLWSLFLFLFPSILVLVKKRKKMSLMEFVKAVSLLQVYFVARAIAVFTPNKKD